MTALQYGVSVILLHGVLFPETVHNQVYYLVVISPPATAWLLTLWAFIWLSELKLIPHLSHVKTSSFFPSDIAQFVNSCWSNLGIRSMPCFSMLGLLETMITCLSSPPWLSEYAKKNSQCSISPNNVCVLFLSQTLERGAYSFQEVHSEDLLLRM